MEMNGCKINQKIARTVGKGREGVVKILLERESVDFGRVGTVLEFWSNTTLLGHPQGV